MLEVLLEAAPSDGVAPDNFYSTTNNPTYISISGKWVKVEDQMMDKVIVVNSMEKTARCKPIRELKKEDLVVVGNKGIRETLPKEEEKETFRFMSMDVSSEKNIGLMVHQVAESLQQIKKRKGKIIVVAGPALVHSGAGNALAELIRIGYVNTLLSGNALAVHDIEYALYGTSLGVNLESGQSALGSNRNHMAAINEVLKSGSLRRIVESGKVRSGIIYECVKNNVPYVLAGSIRDDGPLPDTITDVVKSQKSYREALKGAEIVLMLGSMLHSIAVGNMLPSTVKIICVDINPAAIAKLINRGTIQQIGVVSDIGLFLPALVEELRLIEKKH
jgi:lysine-ketoglutarate reductase/saccharopine dehydrogenase-like protein (TIGR00300 family)